MKRRMTRLFGKAWLLLALGVVGAIVAVGCGGGASPTDTPSAPATTAAPTATQQFDAANYFKGKTITIVVPLGAGGGTDLTARTLAPLWSQFIPGNPRVNVINKTPHVAGQNYVWNSKADGLTLMLDALDNMYGQQFVEGAQGNAGGWQYIGAPTGFYETWLLRQNVPYQSVKDAEGGSTPLIHGVNALDPSQIEPTNLNVMLLASWLNLPLKYVGITNFSSTSVMYPAFERGDVNTIIRGIKWLTMPVERPDWIPSGFVRPFLSLSPPSVTIPDNSQAKWTAPNAVDFLTPDQKSEWLSLLSYPSFDKGVMAPPGTPADVVQALRDSYAATLQDSASVAKMQTALGSVPIHLVKGSDMQQEVEQKANSYDSTYKSVYTQQKIQDLLNQFS